MELRATCGSGMTLALSVVLVVAVVACGASGGEPASSTRVPDSPTAAPTAEPTIDIALAAKQTLAALDAYNLVYDASLKKYKRKTAESCRNWAKVMLDAERKLAVDILAISYPPDAQEHADTMLEWGAEAQIILRQAAKAKTVSAWKAIMAPYNAVDRKAAAAGALLRTVLGLPPRN